MKLYFVRLGQMYSKVGMNSLQREYCEYLSNYIRKVYPANVMTDLLETIGTNLRLIALNNNRCKPIDFRLYSEENTAMPPDFDYCIHIEDTITIYLEVGALETALLESKATCKHCGNTFTKNAPKHVFCSDDCRKESWENRTGAKLKLKKSAK